MVILFCHLRVHVRYDSFYGFKSFIKILFAILNYSLVDGGFGSWSGFSECSKLCGNGLQTRTRKCDQPEPAHGGKDCIGIAIETNECKIVDCPSKLLILNFNALHAIKFFLFLILFKMFS